MDKCGYLHRFVPLYAVFVSKRALLFMVNFVTVAVIVACGFLVYSLQVRIKHAAMYNCAFRKGRQDERETVPIL